MIIGVAAMGLAVGLIAAACAKDDPAASGPAGSGPNSTGVQGAPPGQGAQPDITIAPSGKPKTGGTIGYAVEAETSGYNPTVDRWAISGTEVGLAIFDPLAALDANEQPQPYLAQKWEPSSDFKTWKITLRSGIKFHDGSPLTAAAVKQEYDAHLKSGLTRPALGPIQSIDVVDDLTVQFNMSSPWAVFPTALTGQIGVIAAPSQLNMGDAASSNPIGTGPFKLKNWVRDGQLDVVKNPDYWRKDSDGTQLPYLDGVSFRPLQENGQRANALESGQVAMFHTDDGPTIEKARASAKEGKNQIVEDHGETEEGFLMLNTSKPPFDQLSARQAVAYATDRQAYNDALSNDIPDTADGVFTKNSPWYIDSKFPTYDIEKAKQYAAQYQQDTGQPIKFTIGVGGPDTKKNGEFLQAEYKAAGIDADVQVVDQGSFITQALGGMYQANLWRQFGSPDPDADALWWLSDNAQGALTLNFARNKDPQIDKALQDGRATTDVDARKKAYATLQERFTADVPYVWLDRSLWAIVAANNLRGIANGPLPDGQPSLPIGGSGFPGVHRLTQTWVAS
jgi:peptide/nickel transport system substrate-binding protein